MYVIQLFNDFISLFYPDVCLCCGESLGKQEEFVCTLCLFKLPTTNYHLKPENELRHMFWGHAPVNAAAAYLFFKKGNQVQKIVHQLKYRGKKELGTCLGRWYGKDLKESGFFQNAEIIIPVPLHKKRLKRRGYNQSAFFARGLAEAMGLSAREDILIRKVNTSTQTKKTRMGRWENVKGIFDVPNKESIVGKNVLVVDDIITTGATLTACVQTLSDAGAATVSVASIGYAKI